MTKFLKAKDRIDAIFAVITKIAQVIAAIFLCIMIVDVSIQVVGRICRFKIPVTEEIATYSLIWMTYIASIAVTARSEHLTVDILLNRYSAKAKRYVRLIIDLMIAIFCGMLMIFGFMLIKSPIIINGRTPALQISRVWIYLSVPIAMVFNTCYTVYDFILAIYDIATGGKLTALAEAKKAEQEAAEREAQQAEAAAIRAAMLGDNSGENAEKEDK